MQPNELAERLGERLSSQCKRDLRDLAHYLMGSELERSACQCLLVAIYPFIQKADSDLDPLAQAALRAEVLKRLDVLLALTHDKPSDAAIS